MSSWTLKSIPPHDWFLCLDVESYFDHEHPFVAAMHLFAVIYCVVVGLLKSLFVVVVHKKPCLLFVYFVHISIMKIAIISYLKRYGFNDRWNPRN